MSVKCTHAPPHTYIRIYACVICTRILFYSLFSGHILQHAELPQPGIKPVPPAVEAHSLNQWTTRNSWVHATPASSPSTQLLSCSLQSILGWPSFHRQKAVSPHQPLTGCISVQSLSHVRLFVTSFTASHQASLSIINSWSLLKLMSIELVMPSNHLILSYPLLLLPSIFPSIRVFSNESALCIRWPKYWSFSFSISPSNEYSGLISFRMGWLDLLAVQRTLRVFSNTTAQKRQFFSAQLSL